MCLFIDEEKTAELKRTHPRVTKWKKWLMVMPDGRVTSPYRSNFVWTPGWTEAVATDYDPIQGFVIKGGALHVFVNGSYNQGGYPVITAYGLREDFIAIGKDGDGVVAACYRKLYIPKVAWRRCEKLSNHILY